MKDLYKVPNLVMVISSRRLIWLGHLQRIKASRILAEQSKKQKTMLEVITKEEISNGELSTTFQRMSLLGYGPESTDDSRT